MGEGGAVFAGLYVLYDRIGPSADRCQAESEADAWCGDHDLSGRVELDARPGLFPEPSGEGEIGHIVAGGQAARRPYRAYRVRRQFFRAAADYDRLCLGEDVSVVDRYRGGSGSGYGDRGCAYDGGSKFQRAEREESRDNIDYRW